MVLTSNDFDFPESYKDFILNRRTELFELTNLWSSTILIHKSPFDQWIKQAKPQHILTRLGDRTSQVRDLIKEVQLTKYLPNIPNMDQKKINKLKAYWSKTYSISHSLNFDTWLEETKIKKGEHNPSISTNTIQSFFTYDANLIPDCNSHLHNIDMDQDTQVILDNFQQSLSQKVLWKNEFLKHYIPPYPYLPKSFLEDIDPSLQHQDSITKHHIWKATRKAYVEKINNEPRDVPPTTKNIPIVFYLQQKHRKTPHQLSGDPSSISHHLPTHSSSQICQIIRFPSKTVTRRLL